LTEAQLAPHNRTNEKTPGRIPLTWVDSPNFGFFSFMDCYQYYEWEAEHNSSFDITQTFKIEYKKMGAGRGKLFRGPDRSDPYAKEHPNQRLSREPGTLDMLKYMNEVEVY